MPIDAHLFQLYLVAAAVLVLIPGPDTLLVLSRGLFDGRRAGWIATSGIASGNIVHATLAAAGISAVIAASPGLFDLLRVAGAFYLAWLGVKAVTGACRAWRRRDGGGGGEDAAIGRVQPAGTARTFTHALLTNLLNPKIILFYLAFVPQFVSPAAGSIAAQTFLLGAVLAFLGFLYQAVLAAAAAGAARRIVNNRRFRAAVDGIAGVLFLAFAVRLFLTERRFA
jgi:threonine/homoserine/homoserine lactone efflux protein